MTIKDFYIQVEYILIHRIFSPSNELRSYYRVLANKIDNENHRNVYLIESMLVNLIKCMMNE